MMASISGTINPRARISTHAHTHTLTVTHTHTHTHILNALILTFGGNNTITYFILKYNEAVKM